MSGLLRNLLTIIAALWRYNSGSPLARTVAWFFITPLDTGITRLKSDKYLQLAEAAQLDYLIQTGVIGGVLAKGYSFVNAAQLVKFAKPVGIFSRVQVETRVLYADDKCAYFSHTFMVGQVRHAEVLVKMKFKKGPVTVAPGTVLGAFTGDKPLCVQRWDETLAAL
jgi:hypothetical protein